MKPSTILIVGTLAAFAVAPAYARIYGQSPTGGARNNALIQSAIADGTAQGLVDRLGDGADPELEDGYILNECGDVNIGPQIEAGADAPDDVIIVLDNVINYCAH